MYTAQSLICDKTWIDCLTLTRQWRQIFSTWDLWGRFLSSEPHAQRLQSVGRGDGPAARATSALSAHKSAGQHGKAGILGRWRHLQPKPRALGWCGGVRPLSCEPTGTHALPGRFSQSAKEEKTIRMRVRENNNTNMFKMDGPWIKRFGD